MNYLEEGVSFCNKGEFENALNQFDKGLKANPGDLKLLINRAKVLVKLDRLPAALKDFDTAHKLSPEDAEILSERAILHFFLGDQMKSMADFDAAVSLEPENPYRYSSRAFIKDRFGDSEGAIKDYKKTLELDPEDAIAYNNLGLAYEKIGYQKKAKEAFNKADEKDPAKVESGAPIHANDTESTREIKLPEEPPKAEDLNTQVFFRTIKEVFTTKKGFNEFKDFVKSRISGSTS